MENAITMSGAELRRIRKRFRLTQTQWGERLCGSTMQTVSDWERDRWPVPRPVAHLARLLDNNPSRLAEIDAELADEIAEKLP